MIIVKYDPNKPLAKEQAEEIVKSMNSEGYYAIAMPDYIDVYVAIPPKI